MHSPISAKEVLGFVCRTELDAPILPQRDPRWAQLRFDRVPGVDLRDHFRGALIGDAMGRAVEGVWPHEARDRRIREHHPWHGYTNGPKGTITDDTQMTMWLAEAILGASHEPRAVNRVPRERAEGQRGAGAEEQGRRGRGEGKRTVRGARGEASP